MTCILLLVADSASAVTFKGWEILAKKVERPGESYSSGFQEFTAVPGQEVLAVTLSFRNMVNAEQFSVRLAVLDPDGKEIASVKEWGLYPGPKPSAKMNDQVLPFSIPKGARAHALVLGGGPTITLPKAP